MDRQKVPSRVQCLSGKVQLVALEEFILRILFPEVSVFEARVPYPLAWRPLAEGYTT